MDERIRKALCHALDDAMPGIRVCAAQIALRPERVRTMQEEFNKSVAAQSRRENTPDAESAAGIVGNTVAESSGKVASGLDLIAAQQNQLLGEWTWRIVQELRNCLQVISGHGEMLCLTMGNDELRWHKEEIEKAVNHAGEMASCLQTLAENGMHMSEDEAPAVKCGGSGPQETASSEITSSTQQAASWGDPCTACKLLRSLGRTVFWRKVPSLRGLFSVEFLNQPKPGGVGGIREARQ